MSQVGNLNYYGDRKTSSGFKSFASKPTPSISTKQSFATPKKLLILSSPNVSTNGNASSGRQAYFGDAQDENIHQRKDFAQNIPVEKSTPKVVSSAPSPVSKLSAGLSGDCQPNGRARSGSSSKRVRFSPELVSYEKCTFPIDSQSPSAMKVQSISIAVEQDPPMLQLPQKLVSSAQQPKKIFPTRPSLSEQLAAIGLAAEALTVDIRAKAGLDEPSGGGVGQDSSPIFSMPTKSFSVGNLNCRYPSPVRFFKDRCEYIFHHPFDSVEITMIMHYKDMIGPSITGCKLRFKLSHKLSQFQSDFDPSNPQHAIAIELSSTLAVASVRQKILPLMSQSSFCPPLSSPSTTR